MNTARILANSKIVVQELMAEPDPLPLISACAVAGNGWQENLMEPVTRGRKDHGSDGLLQWRLDRLYALQRLKDWDTLPVQCRFFKDECKVQYPQLWAQLVDPGKRTLENLTANICMVYERPSVAGRVMDKRIAYARRVMEYNKADAMPEVLKPIVETPGASLVGFIAMAWGWIQQHAGTANWQLWVLIGLVLIFWIRKPADTSVPEDPLPDTQENGTMTTPGVLEIIAVLEKLTPLIFKVFEEIPQIKADIEALKNAATQPTAADNELTNRVQDLVDKLNKLGG